MAGEQVQKANPLSAPGRRNPKQERSRKTVEFILDATLELLEEEGFAGVTMQKIADRAEINVAAVYGYFPNKHQVIAELHDRMFTARHELRGRLFKKLLGLEGDWVDNFVEALHEIAKWQKEQRGQAALRNAMRASPSLWRLRMQYLDRTIDQFEHFLEQVDPGFAGDQRARSRVIVETVAAIVDLLQIREENWPSPTVHELIRMIRHYLKAA